MDQQKVIAEIEARAKAVGLTTGDACRLAKVHPVTFSRWKMSEKNPVPKAAGLPLILRIQNVLADREHATPTKRTRTADAVSAI